MRKAQKEQVNNFISLLAEAQEEIKNAVRKKNVPLALDLLEQCQQGAIHLGTLIDSLEGEGHPTVALLEQYCEVVYKLHEQLAAETLKAGTDAASYVKQQLDMVLTQITNSAEKNIPVRLEVVFCPYKASMWDSLESVWKAASEDVNCDTYVIPIPYYDKNPDGSFREEHYEGLEYPEYVPITYYKSYNFEERKPDVVFIHNPYDEYNYVTSVHPFFYASNLVKYTDKLVYIPYFVLEEVNWDTMTEEAKKKMRTFCIQPGVLNSHKTIVQSESMKQVYVNLLCKEFGEQHREMWESKILGLGSPKLDKISKMTTENIVIPGEWKPVLDKPDGTRKKVVLYNTGVSALLEQREKMLEKIKNSLQIFYDNREEIALLWRPHPLIKATISSMVPDLWTEYEKIVEDYKHAGWGIYDDTADLNRAIALADAYYGDTSSLVQLCREKGMPVMVQQFSESSNCFSDCCFVSDNIYFYEIHIQALVSYNFISGKTKILTDLIAEGKKIVNVDCMIECEKTIYMLDMHGKYLVIYFIPSNTYKIVRINCNVKDVWNFATMVCFQKEIYIFPRYLNYILKVKENRVEKIGLSLYDVLHNNGVQAPYFVCGVQMDNEVWLMGDNGDYICRYQLGTDKYELFFVSSDNRGCFFACLTQKKILRLDRYGKITEWDLEEKKLLDVLDLQSELDEFGRIIVGTEKMLLLPAYGQEIREVFMDRYTQSLYVSYPKDFKYGLMGGIKYWNFFEDDEFIYMAMQSSNYMLKFSKKNNSIEWVKIPKASIRMTKEKTSYLIDEKYMLLETLIDNLIEQM